MQSFGEEQKRVVKKIVRHGGGHHGGAWKVAYADFVTAMMALFIVLWIVGQSKSVKEAVAAHFKDPTVFSQGSAGVLKGGGTSPTPAPSFPAPPAPPAPSDPPSKAGSDRANLEAAEKRLKEEIHKQAHLAKLEQKIAIEITEEGLRIQLMETTHGVFFDVGSARIKPATQEVLGLVAAQISRLPNDVVIEGHTDSRPYVGQPSYSNWELSADRANAARRILTGSGLRAEQIASVVGYADRRLAIQGDPLDAANRRISITVRFRDPPERPRKDDGAPPGRAKG
jgi:chemotaxis protein MotB